MFIVVKPKNQSFSSGENYEAGASGMTSIRPLAVLNKLMGELPLVMRVD